jgi:NADH-quinone oxidoreductase subunit J
MGVSSALLVLGCLVMCILCSNLPRHLPAPGNIPPVISVKDIGNTLMQDYVLPLEVLGLLLTAALIGAVVLAQSDSTTGADKSKSPPC